MRKVNEVGITKYLPFVVKKKSYKHYEAQFAVDASKIQIQIDNQWHNFTDIYPNRDSVLYKVKIVSSVHPTIVPIRRENIEDRIKVFTHTVMFNNDTTSMSNLKSNIGFMVFSTVAKVLNEFTDTFWSDFQCFKFTPAHPKLVGVYEILAKEAEKRGLLVYLNKDIGKDSLIWYLLSSKLWNKYKDIKHIKGDTR